MCMKHIILDSVHVTDSALPSGSSKLGDGYSHKRLQGYRCHLESNHEGSHDQARHFITSFVKFVYIVSYTIHNRMFHSHELCLIPCYGQIIFLGERSIYRSECEFLLLKYVSKKICLRY